MAFAVIMPKAGMAMETGTIIRWLKQEGDAVAVGEPLLEIETDKVSMEVEAEADGVLLRIIRGDGEEVPVTETIGYIGEVGETMAEVLREAPAAEAEPASGQEPVSPAPRADVPGGVAKREAVGSGLPGAVSPARANADARGKIRATPAARRLAGELGVALNSVSPTGRRGEVTADDVRRAAVGSAPGTRRPLTSMRRAIALAMRLSQQIPQFSVYADACVDGLLDQRDETVDRDSGRPGITALVVRALALALREAPEMAIVLDGDEVVDRVDPGIGVAVSVPGGIVVPVVRGTAELSAVETGAEVRRLVDLARGGAAGPDGSIAVTTVSNLGMYGVSHFAPMLTPPQSSALGVGAVRSVPALVDGALVEQKMLSLSLTVDHRIIDGAEAARFLQTVIRRLEAPF